MKKIFAIVIALAIGFFLFISQRDSQKDPRKDSSQSPAAKSCVLDEEFKVILAQCDRWCKNYGFSGNQFIECKAGCIDSRCADLEKKKSLY